MKLLGFLTVILLFFSCGNEDTEFDDLVVNVQLERDELIANGVDSLAVTVVFNSDASLELIKAKAKLSNGVFLDSKTSSTELVPLRLPDNRLKCEFKIKSNTKNIDHVLTINVNEFVEMVDIKSIKSKPNNISVKLSALSALNNFRSTISISGSLSNSNGKKVSEGASVIFEAKLESGSDPSGTMVINNASSNSNSKVSADYIPGLVEVGENIIIMVKVLDENGEITNISDSEQILIINE